MASRGIWHFMGARTRRSLALSWTALFVLSLLLQYFTFAAAAPVAAHVNSSLFELDGNATDSTGAGLPDDWDRVAAHTDSADSALFITDGFNAGDDIFTGGNTKDVDNITSWQWKSGSVQDKDDIENAFAAAYTSGGNTYVYFGLDRYQTSGDATAGFWFLKAGVGKAGDGSFTGAHTEGDVLVVLDFSTGGSTASAQIYTWHNGALTAGPSGTGCTAATVQSICAIANTSTVSSPWVYDDKSVDAGPDDDFPANALFEGGINLTALQLDTGCFSTFIAETRSSTSETSTLSDVALGSFSLCVPPTIATQVKKDGQSTGSNGHITIGESVTDTATISGSKGAGAGTVDFFRCFNANSTPDCSSGGTKVGATKTLSGGSATSDPFTPIAVGNYCFRVEYTPATGSKYLPGSHTNTTTECFVVDKKVPSISTTATTTVSISGSISDSAILSGTTSDAGGSITFRAYGPANPNCSGTAAFTSAPFAVNGDGTYGPATFTPDTAGTYRWIATYSGDNKNALKAGACNDDGETSTVTKVNPTIATQASAPVIVGGQISDTATVSAGHSPTGTVTFNLYGPTDANCLGNPIFTSANRPLSGGSATSAAYTTTAIGTYRWIATYNGDANNNSVSGACNDANESVVVSPTSPSITTSLVGGNKSGASITVPLGTAVHDTSTLVNATANAGGTVHYRIFTDATCDTLLTDAGTIDVVNGLPGSSSSYTFNQAGKYYWQADYSGDVNNEPATSACNLEIVTVEPNIPSISTQASAPVVVGGQIHDTAILSGGFGPTGTITFSLYGPDNDSCTGPAIFTTTKAVTGNGSYVSANFTTTAAGTYRWIASYGGDSNNAPVAGGCNDANENVDVSKKSPTVVTQASAAVDVGGSISDSATLAGGLNPTGTISFNLYGPNDTTCTGAVIFTATVPVSGNAVYPSGSFVTTVAGTYRWIANYSGDANNDATANGCNGANENVVVSRKSPTVVTQASASVEVGGQIHDTATLAGGFSPTGTITFNLYGPNNATCSGAPIFSSTVNVTLGNHAYDSASFTTTVAGTYRWIANYGGDANNNATANGCNGANENVVVSQANPTIDTLATEGGVQGELIHDTATVSGGFHPTGTVTFSLYDNDDANCDGTPIFTSTVSLAANGTATSGTFAAPASGTYHWIASYSGDANNAAATGVCGAEGETTIISRFSPDITTALHSGNLVGAKITVLFGSSVTDQATLTGAGPTASGSVTYTVFSDAACETVFADAGEKTVTNGSVPASNPVTFPVAGTYYWQAHYSGDLNNAPATSACTDEVLTVTTPNLHAVKLVSTNDGAFGPTSSALPGDVLHYQITISNSGNGAATNVPVSDDIAAILAHATYNNDCSDGCTKLGSVLSWTIPSIAAGGSEVVTFSVTLSATFPTGTTHLPNVVVVTGPGSNCAAESEDADCDTDTTVGSSALDIAKSFTGNTGGIDPILDVPLATIGDTLHFTLTYTGGGPLTNAVITDVLPVGLAYVAGSAAGDANFTFIGFDSGTRTLTWMAATLPSPASGSVTYNVLVLAAAAEQLQPLTNTASIDSDETAPDSDTADVAVLTPPLAVTGTPRITLPPTDTAFTPEKGTSNPGFTLMLILLGLAGLALSIGYVTPAPERVRRRDRQG